MNIQKKILLTFISLLAIPMIILAGISSFEIISMSEINAKDTASALIDEQLDNLAKIANDEAIYIDETFKQIENEIIMLDNYAEDLFNNRINITPQHSYYWDQQQEFAHSGRTIPGIGYNSEYDSYISFEVSCYYLPRQFMRNNDPFDLSEEMEYILNTSSNLDNMFRSLHAANPNYVWIYAGFEGEGHLFKNYPYDSMAWCYGEDGNGYEDYNDGTDYDPHREVWYKNAIDQVNGTTAFTSPYWDPAGLLMSIGRPITYSNGTLIGVVSADITITTINENILGIKVMDSGYAFLLDNKGTVISHPKVDPEAEELPTIGDLEFPNSETEKQTFVNNIVKRMTTDNAKGTEPFIKDGKKWYISYVPINTTGYSLGIVVPEEEVIASAIAIRDTIIGLSIQQTFIFIIILSAIIVGVVIVGSMISNKVIQPIKELTTMVNFVAEGDLSRDLRGNASQMGKEVATLHSAFDNLLTSLRFGNTDYYRGDLRRAYENYKKALELFTTTKNQRGIAIAKNNLGNIHRAWGNFEKARRYYEEAIQIGQSQGDKKGLASRYNNLALLLLDQKNYNAALQLLEKARQLDQETNNQKGLITRIGNIGIVYERLNNFNKAEQLYKEAIHLAEKSGDERGLANSYLKYAVFFMKQEKYEEALKYLTQSFEKAKAIDDVNVAVNSLERMAIVYEELDQPTESHRVRVNVEKIKKKLNPPKIALFVLDYSGSMYGAKIRSVIEGTKKLLVDQVNPQDKVGIVIFNNASRTILPLTNVENNERQIIKLVSGLKYPDGITAFYDALGDALVFLNDERGNEQKWLIALTDGEDNASQRWTIDRPRRKGFMAKIFGELSGKRSIPEFIDENLLTINLVIIGIGREVKRMEYSLRKLCETTPRGRYIDLSSPGTDIGQAIDKAFEKIKEVMGEVDVEGFSFSDE